MERLISLVTHPPGRESKSQEDIATVLQFLIENLRRKPPHLYVMHLHWRASCVDCHLHIRWHLWTSFTCLLFVFHPWDLYESQNVFFSWPQIDSPSSSCLAQVVQVALPAFGTQPQPTRYCQGRSYPLEQSWLNKPYQVIHQNTTELKMNPQKNPSVSPWS